MIRGVIQVRALSAQQYEPGHATLLLSQDHRLLVRPRSPASGIGRQWTWPRTSRLEVLFALCQARRAPYSNPKRPCVGSVGAKTLTGPPCRWPPSSSLCRPQDRKKWRDGVLKAASAFLHALCERWGVERREFYSRSERDLFWAAPGSVSSLQSGHAMGHKACTCGALHQTHPWHLV